MWCRCRSASGSLRHFARGALLEAGGLAHVRPGAVAAAASPDLLHGALGRLVHRHAAVEVLDAVLLEDLEALLLPGARDAEDGDLLGRVVPQLEAGLDHAAGDDVHAGVR